MKCLFYVFILAIILLLTACMGPTPYQKRGTDIRGGYEDAHLKDNLYVIYVSCNAFTSPVTASQYFYRRAKELCEENGYSNFQVKELTGDVTKDITLMSGGGLSGATVTHNKPNVSGYVECLK